MKQHKIGVFTLAASLIAIGVLALLSNFYNLDFGKSFKFFFPIVLILLGLEITFTKIIFAKRDDVVCRVDTKSIVFTVILLIFSFFFFFANIVIDGVQMNLGNLRNFNITGFNFDYKYEINNNSTEVVKPDESKSNLIVSNAYGLVKIIPSDDNQIHITKDITFGTNDEEYGNSIIEKIYEINADYDSKSVKIENNISQYTRNNKIGNMELNLTIKVPKKYSAKVDNKHGNIVIENLDGYIDVENRHGNITARNILDKVTLDDEFGNITLENIGNDVDLKIQHGNIDTKDISGNMNLDCKFSDIKVENVSGNIVNNQKHGNIDIDGANSIKLDSEHANIDIDDIKQFASIKSRHGNIELDNNILITESIDVKCEYGNIEINVLEQQQGEYDVTTEYGNINTDFDTPEVDENKNRQSFKKIVGNSNVKIKLENRHGNIDIN